MLQISKERETLRNKLVDLKDLINSIDLSKKDKDKLCNKIDGILYWIFIRVGTIR